MEGLLRNLCFNIIITIIIIIYVFIYYIIIIIIPYNPHTDTKTIARKNRVQYRSQ